MSDELERHRDFQTVASAKASIDSLIEESKMKDAQIEGMKTSLVVAEKKAAPLARLEEVFGRRAGPIVEGLRKMYEDFSAVTSFKDVHRLLKGHGLSDSTYRQYTFAYKLLYDFTGGLAPHSIEPDHIEDWFDSMKNGKTMKPETVFSTVKNVKNFFELLSRRYACFVSPFHHSRMDDRLRKKLTARYAGSDAKVPILSYQECNDFIHWVRKGNLGLYEKRIEIQELRLKVVVLVLASSGIRVGELVRLTVDNLRKHADGRWYIDDYWSKDNIITKGVRIHEMAVEAALEYVQKVQGRQPRKDDRLLYSHGSPTKVKPCNAEEVVWRWLNEAGERAKELGIIKDPAARMYPHMWRAQKVTRLKSKNWSDEEVQRTTKHANIQMIRVYDHNPAAAPRDPLEEFTDWYS